MCYTSGLSLKRFGDIPVSTEKAFQHDPIKRKKGYNLKKTKKQKAQTEKDSFWAGWCKVLNKCRTGLLSI